MTARPAAGSGGAARAHGARGGGRWWAGQRELLAITASLISTAGITSVLGVAFWGLAAHLVPVATVGYGSAAVSALTLVGAFGMAGLNTVLIGHLARQPRDANGVLAASLYASGLISAALATGFWLVAAVLVPRIAPYLHTPAEAALFVAGSALTGVTGVLDEALLGLFGGGPQLWRNTTWAVTKLAALAGFAMLWHDRLGTSILAAWTAGTALSVIPVVVLLRRRGVRMLAAPRWRALRRLGRASVSNTWLNNALLAPTLVLPLLVTGLLSPAEGGAFYVAWNIVTLASWLSFHFTSALYATGAANPRELAAKLRFTLRTCLCCGLIGVPLVVAGAHPLLRLFGSEYAARAAAPLQWLMLGYFGGVLRNHYVALCRISQRVTRAGIYATATCAARLAAACAGAATGGLTGLSVALVAVMTAEGAVVLPAVRAVLRGSGRHRHGTAVSGVHRREDGTDMSANHRGSSLRHVAGQHIGNAAWTVSGWLPHASLDHENYDRIYLYHVRKTAGTSIAFAFMRLSGADPHVIERGLSRFTFAQCAGYRYVANNASLVRQGNYFFAYGHAPAYAVHPPDARTFRVTVMRDPVDRVVSLFRYLASPSSDAGFSLTAPAEQREWAADGFDRFLDRIPDWHLMNQLYMLSETGSVDEAVDYLNKLDMVLRTESLEADLNCLGEALNLNLTASRERASQRPFVPTGAQLDRLHDLLQPEFEILRQIRHGRDGLDALRAWRTVPARIVTAGGPASAGRLARGRRLG